MSSTLLFVTMMLGTRADAQPAASTSTAKPPASASKATASTKTVVSAPANSSAVLDAIFPVGEARPLFDGKTLRGWKITDFAGHGDASVVPSLKGAPALVVEAGAALSGVTWTNPLPKIDYEVELDAMKLLGSDFFCGLTMPVANSFCTFVCGGWGGSVVGISSVDGQDASLNETTKYIKFDDDRWYHLKVRVTKDRIEAWVDQEKTVDLETTGKKISMRFGEISESEPFGLATYQTRAAFRNITLKRLAP